MNTDIPILIFHEDSKGKSTAKSLILKSVPEIVLSPVFEDKEIFQVFLPEGVTIDDLDQVTISISYKLRKEEIEIDNNMPFEEFNQICKNNYFQLIIFTEELLERDEDGTAYLSLSEHVLQELEFFKKAPLIPHPSEIPHPVQELKTFLSLSLATWYDSKQVFSIENHAFPNQYKDNLANIAENAVNFTVNILENNSFTAMSSIFHDNQFPMNYHFCSTLLFDEENYQKLHDLTFNKKVFTDLLVVFLERTYQFSPFFFSRVNNLATISDAPVTMSSITPYRKKTKKDQDIFWLESQDALLDLKKKTQYELVFLNHVAEMVVDVIKTYYGVVNYEKVRSYVMDAPMTKGDFIHCFPLVMKDMKHINQIISNAQNLID